MRYWLVHRSRYSRIADCYNWREHTHQIAKLRICRATRITGAHQNAGLILAIVHASKKLRAGSGGTAQIIANTVIGAGFRTLAITAVLSTAAALAHDQVDPAQIGINPGLN